jgi:hypothetical protein
MDVVMTMQRGFPIVCCYDNAIFHFSFCGVGWSEPQKELTLLVFLGWNLRNACC